ncbi:MAG: hypothetical protein U5L03_00115 [Burkholderiaceae bacterium]|nr:hypothetical protein [Burkholderiaceae bacterium]
MAKLLDKLRVEFARSRPRHSNDNGLAETKTARSCARPSGYTPHRREHHAGRFDTFCREYLNPFLNFHRPCLFATEVPDPEETRPHQAGVPPARCDDAAGQAGQPWRSSAVAARGITLQDLQALACALTDVQAAEELNAARQALFKRTPCTRGLNPGR